MRPTDRTRAYACERNHNIVAIAARDCPHGPIHTHGPTHDPTLDPRSLTP